MEGGGRSGRNEREGFWGGSIEGYCLCSGITLEDSYMFLWQMNSLYEFIDCTAGYAGRMAGALVVGFVKHCRESIYHKMYITSDDSNILSPSRSSRD